MPPVPLISRLKCSYPVLYNSRIRQKTISSCIKHFSPSRRIARIFQLSFNKELSSIERASLFIAFTCTRVRQLLYPMNNKKKISQKHQWQVFALVPQLVLVHKTQLTQLSTGNDPCIPSSCPTAVLYSGVRTPCEAVSLFYCVDWGLCWLHKKIHAQKLPGNQHGTVATALLPLFSIADSSGTMDLTAPSPSKPKDFFPNSKILFFLIFSMLFVIFSTRRYCQEFFFQRSNKRFSGAFSWTKMLEMFAPLDQNCNFQIFSRWGRDIKSVFIKCLQKRNPRGMRIQRESGQVVHSDRHSVLRNSKTIWKSCESCGNIFSAWQFVIPCEEHQLYSQDVMAPKSEPQMGLVKDPRPKKTAKVFTQTHGVILGTLETILLIVSLWWQETQSGTRNSFDVFRPPPAMCVGHWPISAVSDIVGWETPLPLGTIRLLSIVSTAAWDWRL